ncbi:hypothetical protein B0T13DRAFT_77144 [Neurospora crassa]|nr:hypothetical protein B0T13DRAFT_77144 [Neurospora crassa]
MVLTRSHWCLFLTLIWSWSAGEVKVEAVDDCLCGDGCGNVGVSRGAKGEKNLRQKQAKISKSFKSRVGPVKGGGFGEHDRRGDLI